MNAKNKGIACENIVIKYFLSRKYFLVKQRYHINNIEIDLLFKSINKNEWLIVEVKSLSDYNFLNFRISGNQKRRLKKACLFFQSQSKFQENCSLFLAFVDNKNEITIVKDF